MKEKEYDFYFWLNDDTILFKNAIQNMLTDAEKWKGAIIVGVFQSSDKEKHCLTYGGRDKNHRLLIPDGTPQEVRYIEGNLVVVPKSAFNRLGFIDKCFTHATGDSDYGVRANKAGIPVYISSAIVGICDINPIEDWKNPKMPFSKRFCSFRATKNFLLKEQIIFSYRDRGLKGVSKLILRTTLLLISPSLYYSLKK